VTALMSIVGEVARRSGLRFGELSVITLDRTRGAEGLAILLVFADGAESPSLLVKLTSDPTAAVRLRQEHDNLTLLHRRGSEGLRAGIPTPLCLDEIGGQHVFAETAFDGTRMKNFVPDRYFRSADFPRHLQRVVGWLIEFHRLDDPALEPVEEDRATTAIREYRDAFEVSPALDALLETTESTLTDAPVRWCAWHEDFCTANVLVAADRLQVIDWEHPLRTSWPLADLLHFLMSVWCVPYAKGRAAKERNYRRLLFEDHGLADPLREAAQAYAGGLGLEREWLLPLSVIGWVVHANRKRRRLAALGEGPEAADRHWPLVMFDGPRCSNLEILAEDPSSYLLTRFGSS